MSESQNVTGKVFDTALMKRLLRYVNPYLNSFIIALFLTILLAILAPIAPKLIQFTLDNHVAYGDMQSLQRIVLIVLGVLMLRTVIMYVNTYITNWLGQSVIRDMRNQVFKHILNLRLKFFDRSPIGTLQTRVINDVETLNDVFTTGIVRIVGDVLQLVVLIVVMFYENWKLTLAVMSTLPLMILAARIFQSRVKSAFQQVRKAVSNMNAFLQEHITGMPIVHIFNREQEELERFNVINKDLLKANLNAVMYYSVFYPVIEVISSLTLAVLIWYGAGNVLNGEVSRGELVAFIMYVQMFFRPIRMLADQINTLQLGMVSADRIFKILDTKEFIPNEGTYPLSSNGSTTSLTIAFKDVSFAYEEPEWVLKDVNLTIHEGEKFALVGPTGSGKSTIINLISRFYDIQQGQITINGVDIKQIPLESLRSLIGVVLQDVFLFSGSIYDNITLNNPEIPLDVVQDAARRVGIDDFIQTLPGKYDYKVRERGATLSLGQRQLISFARVLVYNPQILVLDEATANIDTESEELIQHAIDTLLAGRTAIIIAHRLSTIQKADNIVVLKKGRIVEQGTHQELLNLKGSYFELYQLQFA